MPVYALFLILTLIFFIIVGTMASCASEGKEPAMASEAVLVESQDMPEGSVQVNGYVCSRLQTRHDAPRERKTCWLPSS